MPTPNPASVRKETLQQQVEELCGATVRASANEPGFHFRARRPEINGRPSGIRAPHLQPDLQQDDLRSFRGAADGIALRLRHSDMALHRSLMPETPTGELLFELMEQLRVETFATLKGTQANLDHRFRSWCAHFCASQLTETHVGLLVYTIAQVVWSRLSGQPVEESTEGLIEPQRMMLAPHIGTYLAGLRRYRHQQADYATQALGIVQVIDELVQVLDSPEKQAENAKEIAKTINTFGLILYPDEGDEGQMPGISSASSRAELLAQLANYKIYSTKYDREVTANTLIQPQQRTTLRQQLDEQIRNQGVNTHRLARELTKVLAVPSRDGWQSGEEAGYIDGRRLPRLITAPDDHRIFQLPRLRPVSHSTVTFLMDNSGSMKAHAPAIAMFLELFTKALEHTGTPTEVLGFSTRSWQGGKLYKEWMRQGRPENPGRLCELQHIVYKDADTAYRRARPAFATLLKPDIYKEGVDGEALLWAANRLLKRPEQRRILIVLSDGCPMETATHLTNDEQYLDSHLVQVANMLQARSDIELYALGFGLDLSRYYRNSLALDLPEPLENKVFMDVIRLLRR